MTIAEPLMGARTAPLSPDAFERKLTEGMAREKEAPGTGFRFTNGCVWARLPPLLRTAHAHSSARVRRSHAPLVFSRGHSKDATSVCIPQYKQGFERLWCGADDLDYGNCGWGDKEAEQLVDTLEWAHAQGIETPAHSLDLSANALPDEALPRLVAALQAGAMPKLRILVLEGNQLTDAGLETLRPLLAGRLSKQLTEFSYGGGMTAAGVSTLVALLADGHLANLALLNLHDNKLSDAGAQALAAALSAGQLPNLEELDVSGNAIGDAGAEALAAAVRGGGGASLEKLAVGNNAFGDASKEALRAACAARGVALHRDMFDVL